MTEVEQRTLTYTHPADVDGEPDEVVRQVVSDLNDAAGQFAAHVDAAARQIRNSYQSAALEKDVSLTPEQLAAAWENSYAASLAKLLVKGALQAHRAASGLTDPFATRV